MKVVLKIFLCIFLFILSNVYRPKDVLTVNSIKTNFILRKSKFLPIFYKISVCPDYCGDRFNFLDCFTIVHAIGDVEKMEYEDDTYTLKIYLPSKPLFNPDMYELHESIEKGKNFIKYKNVRPNYWNSVLFLWD
ncbi:hypothetical protein HDR59_04650 [bacterium]|nr:hypothetical protein [bacterium]